MRFDCAKELAQYIAPKRKAIEVSEESREGVAVIQVHWVRPDDGKPEENEQAVSQWQRHPERQGSRATLKPPLTPPRMLHQPEPYIRRT